MYANQTWTVEGEEVANERYAEYLATVLPQPADYLELRALMKETDWILPKKQDMPDIA
jgi:hypothetical protein